MRRKKFGFPFFGPTLPMDADALASKDALLKKQAEAREMSKDVVVEEVEEVVSAPLRENMVSNAMKFLSNDNVKKSPLVRRVAFLESKGLTSEEISEALRRVGGTAPTATPTPPPLQTVVQVPIVPPRPERSTFKTVAASVIVTLSAIGGMAWIYKSFIGPQIKEIREERRQGIIQQEREEEMARNKSTQPLVPTLPPATPNSLQNNNVTPMSPKNDSLERSVSQLVEAMKSQQNEVNDTLRMVQTVLATPERNTKPLSEQINVKELTNAITELHSLLKTNSPALSSSVPSVASPYRFGKPSSPETTPLRSTKAVQVPTPVVPSEPKKTSFADVMKMVQAGETPPNVKEIDDSAVGIAVPPGDSAPPLKPWQKRRKQKTTQQKALDTEGSPSYLSTFKEKQQTETKDDSTPVSPIQDAVVTEIETKQQEEKENVEKIENSSAIEEEKEESLPVPHQSFTEPQQESVAPQQLFEEPQQESVEESFVEDVTDEVKSEEFVNK